MEFDINGLKIGGHRAIIIAEAGVNHLKRLDYAEELIRSAVRAGADIVKFQTYDAAKLVTKTAPRFWSWEGERSKSGGQYDSYELLATPEYDFTAQLKKLCEKYNVTFMSTPFDSDSVEILDSIGCDVYKIASGDITNYPLLRLVASKGKPIFLSTGASTLSEIKKAVAEIEKIRKVPIVIMHCILCYPTRSVDVNLSALLDLKNNFPNHVIGFSDHSIGSLIPASSVLYGCKVIEKHYTFDKSLPDSADHWLSVNEVEMSELVSNVRILENAIGSGFKSLEKCEEVTRINARRSLVAKGEINAGDKFSEQNLIAKRPGTGISPIFYDELIGLTANCNIADDQVIMPNYVKEDASFKPITVALLKTKKVP